MTRRAFGLGAMAGTLGGAARAETGLFVPPEEAPHEATMMMWPNAMSGYDGDRGFLRHTQDTIVELANQIAAFEPVWMLADRSHHAALKRRLSAAVVLWDIPTDDLWARDAAPLFAMKDGRLVVSHIQFNGWGGKQDLPNDEAVVARMAEAVGVERVSSGLVGEPGGAEHDGHGLVMVHGSSWAFDDRNPGLGRDEISARLAAAYGAERVLWSDGLWGEDITDYHIDGLARFTGPGRVLICLPETPDRDDPFHLAAQKTHEMLLAEGMQVEVIPEPVRRRVRSEEFVASYANYLVCNGAVIAPQFGDRRTDEIARDALARHFPGREIVQLNTDALGELGGGIHCATQQVPRV